MKKWDVHRNKRAVCRGCRTEMSAHVKLLHEHASTCVPLIQLGLVPIPVDPAPRATVQPGLKVVRTSAEEQFIYEMQVTRLIAATNLPFAAVEHPEFLKLMQMLRPGVRLPSRKQVSSTLLPKVYDCELEIVKKFCMGKMASLSMDGWSNITNDPVVGVALSVGEKTFLVETIDTSGVPHTAEALQDYCEKAIEGVEAKFNVEVCSCNFVLFSSVFSPSGGVPCHGQCCKLCTDA